MPVSRRNFLKMAGTIVTAVGLTPLNALAQQANPAQKKTTSGEVLVVLFLRGGVDGLNLVVPYKDKRYREYRPGIAIGEPTRTGGNAAIDLDGFFGLHPNAKPLKTYFDDGRLAVVHAVGNPRNNRSHFTQQDVWETASLNNATTADGWLNRHLQTTTADGLVRAVTIGTSLPRSLRGDAPVQVIRSVKDLAYNNRFGNNAKIAEVLRKLYGNESAGDGAEELARRAGDQLLEGMKVLEPIAKQDYTPAANANYPEQNPLATALRNAAHLIKADIGVEVIEVEYNGWDTHRNQGGATGAYANKVTITTEAIAAFARDLGEKLDDVLLVTQTEFGRTARQNGSGGTDHGHGAALFALGGAIKEYGSGGKVLGEWPGLEPDQLNQKRDLKHTTDFRDVLGEVISEHLGNTQLDKVLPGHEPKGVGLLAKRTPPATNDADAKDAG
jgi:uncharacterized protein (DUF1501 family)